MDEGAESPAASGHVEGLTAGPEGGDTAGGLGTAGSAAGHHDRPQQEGRGAACSMEGHTDGKG